MPPEAPNEDADPAFLFSGKELSVEAVVADATARLVFAGQMRPRQRRAEREARVILAATILQLKRAKGAAEKRAAKHGGSCEDNTGFEQAAMQEASRRYLQALTDLLLSNHDAT